MCCLQLEVGKTYVNEGGHKVKIVLRDDETFGACSRFPFVGKHDGGYLIEYSPSGDTRYTTHTKLVKEYREPVTHKRYVAWYQDSLGNIDTTGQYSTSERAEFYGSNGSSRKLLKVEELSVTV